MKARRTYHFPVGVTSRGAAARRAADAAGAAGAAGGGAARRQALTIFTPLIF